MVVRLTRCLSVAMLAWFGVAGVRAESSLPMTERVDALIARAEAHRLAGEELTALADLDQALRLDAARADALLPRAFLRASADDNAGALADLDRLAGFFPETGGTLLLRGSVLRRLGRDVDAVAAFVAAAERDPADPAGWREAADLERSAGHAAEAVADLGRAIALAPGDAGLRAERGHLLMARGETDAAAVDFDTALAIALGNVEALIGQGDLRYARGWDAGALADYEAADRQQLDPVDCYNRAMILRRLGRMAESRIALDDARGLDPRFYALVDRALASPDAVPAEPLSADDPALAVPPGSAEESFVQAVQAHRNDDSNGAHRAIDRAVASTPTDARILLTAAFMHLDGDPAGALRRPSSGNDTRPVDGRRLGQPRLGLSRRTLL